MKKILIILVLGLVFSCSKQHGQDPAGPGGSSCDGVNAKFAADIFPLIESKCSDDAGCHGAGSINGPGELMNYNQIRNAAGPIKIAISTGRMPQNGSLSPAELRQINCWINNGTQND
jgi:hypothetical protein